MSYWRGAIEFNGFPIHVKLETRVSSTRVPSFKNLGPDGQPRVRKEYDSTGETELVADDQKKKGVEVAKDQFLILSDAAIAQIKDAEKDTVIQPREFVPLNTVDLTLAHRTHKVLPDDKVPASEGAVNQLWNWLVDSKQAYVSQAGMRVGSMDSIIVVYATDADSPQGRGLWAAAMPFRDEVLKVADFEFSDDAKARKVMGEFVETFSADKVSESFDHTHYASEFKRRRDEAIEAAIDGREIAAPQPAATAETPDLMAMMEASIKDAKSKPKPKPKAKAKAKAKA